MLPLNDFKKLVENGVLIACDLVVYNKAGEVLLGERTNAPAKGYWFVPGGRIHKNETMPQAFARITKAELGVSVPSNKFSINGIYDHIYEENFFDDSDFNTHYVIIALEYHDTEELIRLQHNEQNRAFKFMPVEALMADEQVHPFTKSYFQDSPNNRLPLKV